MITIYDGDDPDLPMWMVFRNNISGASGNDQRTSRIYYAWTISVILYFVMKTVSWLMVRKDHLDILMVFLKGITKHDFVADTSLQITDEGMFKRLGNLGNERNTGKGYNKVHARSALAYTQINALAIMELLPNAPINPKTGMKFLLLLLQVKVESKFSGTNHQMVILEYMITIMLQVLMITQQQ